MPRIDPDAKSNGSYTFLQTSGHISQLEKGSVSPLKILSRPTFEILHLLVGTPGGMNPENSGASFRKRFSAGRWVVEATSE